MRRARPVSLLRQLLRLLLLLVALTALAAGAWLWADYQRFAERPLDLGDRELVLEVKLGTSFNQIVSRLRQQRLSRAPRLYWRALAHQMGVLDGLRAGEYAIAQGMTPRVLLERMARGLVIQHQFTILEGWRFADLRAALARDAVLEHRIDALSDTEIMEQLGRIDLNPEGRFLPETYAFVRGQDDLAILRRSFLAMQKLLAAEWQGRAQPSPLRSPEQMLVLASIVEKETGRPDDRQRIAGVFLRRLRIGMRLQTDPSVIYGLGSAFNGNLTRLHLNTDTPYNTYTRAGLPPTPIALPGRAALHAVAHPADGNALYFVARGDGSSEFSATLEAHNAAVRKYQLR